MLILTPLDVLFNYDEVKQMWEKYAENLHDCGNFDHLLKNSHFYSFFVDKKFIGCIYFYQRGDRLFVNAFAGRNTHKINLECFKKALTFYNCDIYAESKEKTAIYCILKCGFKKIVGNIYKYERR